MKKSKENVLSELFDSRIVAILRYAGETDLKQLVEAVWKGGVSAVEITTNTPNWDQAIEQLSNRETRQLIGAGDGN